jgi:D-aminoacyl-tRNA deacylase
LWWWLVFFPFHPAVFAMRIVVQRVKSASVTTVDDGQMISQIGPGILALVGIHQYDTIEDVQYCARRLLGAKLWDNTKIDTTTGAEATNGGGGGAWRHGVKTKGYQVLCVSQFTLYGTLSNKKWQPDYKLAMKSVPAKELYAQFLAKLRQDYELEGKIFDGKFGAMMDVSLVNDGPVTIVIESDPKPPIDGNDEDQTNVPS